MKRRIKIVVSDLHLGLGRVLSDGRMNSLEEFYYDEKFVEFIHYYTHGKFAEFEIELILNGDILNFLQVDYRGHHLTVITESVSLDIARRIVSGHKVFFDALKEFCAKPGNRVTYVIGNHDQPVLWPAVQAYLNEIVGTELRFKNIAYFFDGVHIEHGHMYEAANRIDPRKFFLKKNLAEPILNLPLGSHFFVEVVLKIKKNYPHVDKIRPFNRMVQWSLLNETSVTLKGLMSMLWFFLKSMIVKDPRKSWPLRRILKIFLESAIFPDLGDSARRILNDRRVHTVIFGHTHVYQYRQWASDMEYFNTGTWTELTSLELESLGRITKLTYVLLDYPEDGARPHGRLKEWHGYHRIEGDVAIS